MMEIGKHLRAVRVAHKYLQKDLAEKAGLDRSYVSKLERGLSDPTFSTLQKISDAYTLSVGHLLTYGSEESFSLELEAAIDALKTLKYNMVKVDLTIKPL